MDAGIWDKEHLRAHAMDRGLGVEVMDGLIIGIDY